MSLSLTPSDPPPPVAPAPPGDFGSFYRTTVGPLRGFLTRLLGDHAAAQDIAQDAYVQTYRALQSQPVGKPRSFLFTTARRLASNYRTRRADRMQPTDSSLLEAQAGTSPDPVEAIMARQDSDAFEAAILALPPGCQRVLVLRLKHGLPLADIAQKLGVAPSTVGNQLARAIRLLRDHTPPPPSG